MIVLTTCFSFDEESLKSEVKLAVIIFNVLVILIETNGKRFRLDLSNSPFALWNLHVKNPKLFRIKISFNIYCVLSVDQAFCES